MGILDVFKQKLKIEECKNWLNVTTDKERITEARTLSDQKLSIDRDIIFAKLNEHLACLDAYEIKILNDYPNGVSELKQLLTPEITTCAIEASIVLILLHAQEGVDYIIRVIEQGSTEERENVIRRVATGSFYSDLQNSYRNFILTNAKLIELLIRYLESIEPKEACSALFACTNLRLPCENEKFISLLERSDLANSRNILCHLSDLSDTPLTDRLLRATLRIVNDLETDEYRWGNSSFDLLARFILQGTPEQKRLARQALKQKYVNWPDPHEGHTYGGGRGDAIRALAATSDESEIHWLEERFLAERDEYAKPFLAAIVRVGGQAGKERLKSLLLNDEKHDIAFNVAKEVFKGSGDDEIALAIVKLAECKENDETKICQIYEALLEIGGVVAEKEQKRLLRLTSSNYREYQKTKLRSDRFTFEEIKNKVADSGILDMNTLETAITKLNDSITRGYGDRYDLASLLSNAMILFRFDGETGELPCRHDKLLVHFSDYSRGVFKPSSISQEWLQEHEEDYDADYKLRFIHEGRLYEGIIRNFGDWYDIERLVMIINRALSDTRSEERFNGVKTNDQTAAFAFGNPKNLSKLAKELNMPLENY